MIKELLGNHPEYWDFLTMPVVITLISIFGLGILLLLLRTDRKAHDIKIGSQKFYALLVTVFLVAQIGNTIALFTKHHSENDFYNTLESATIGDIDRNFDAQKISIQKSYYDGQNYLVEAGLDNVVEKTTLSMKYSHDHDMLIPYGVIIEDSIPITEGSPLETVLTEYENLDVNSIDAMQEIERKVGTTGMWGLVFSILGSVLLGIGYVAFLAKHYDEAPFMVIAFTVVAVVVYGISWIGSWNSLNPPINKEQFAAYHIEQNYDIRIPVENTGMRSDNWKVTVETKDTPLAQYSTDVLIFRLNQDYNIFILDNEETDAKKALPIREDSALERLVESL